MNSKLIVILLAVTCFAGAVLSASLKDKSEWKNPFGCTPHVCDVCQKVVDKLKEFGQFDQVKQQLESLCLLISDPQKADACMKKIDQYVNDIKTKSSLAVCQEFKLCK